MQGRGGRTVPRNAELRRPKDFLIFCHRWCSFDFSCRAVDAGPDVLRLLESYEMTLELVHATLAGDRERMLELLMDSESCDTQIMDISHQDEPDPDDEVGSIGQLRPRSLRETAEAMGHQHVLDLLPEEPANRRRRKTRSWYWQRGYQLSFYSLLLYPSKWISLGVDKIEGSRKQLGAHNVYFIATAENTTRIYVR